MTLRPSLVKVSMRTCALERDRRLRTRVSCRVIHVEKIFRTILYVCMHVCMYMCVYVCMYLCMCKCNTHTHAHARAHTHKRMGICKIHHQHSTLNMYHRSHVTDVILSMIIIAWNIAVHVYYTFLHFRGAHGPT